MKKKRDGEEKRRAPEVTGTEKAKGKGTEKPKERETEKTKEKAEKKKYTTGSNIRYVFRHLRRKEGAGSLVICGGNIGLSVLLPFLETALAGAVTACLISGRRPGEILLLMAGYVALLQIVRFLYGHIKQRWHKALFLLRIDTGMDFFEKTLWMDGQCLESAQGQQKWGAAMRMIYSGNDRGIEAYLQNLGDASLQLAGLIVYSVIVGRLSLVLLLLLLALTLLVSYLHTRAGKKAYAIEKDVEKNFIQLQYLRRESILAGNGKDIRMYRMDQWFLNCFREIIRRIGTLVNRQQSGHMAAGMAEDLISFGRNVVVYGWLIREMAMGNVSLPAFLLYVGVVAGFGSWLNGMMESWQKVQENEPLIDGYRDFMDFGSLEEGRPGPERAGSVHEIRLEHVSFRYEGNEEDTIRDLSLTIRPGEKLALVGLNGAGKTTLIKLLCGLYRPTAGHIYLDGKDMEELSRKEIFREFAVVFQDVFAFSFSLADNVACKGEGRKEEKRLRDSLEKAGLWSRVQELPEKENTIMNKDLDEAGVSLSGGELQKLMLARALYKDAPMVILDEPTAALDPIAESEMYEKYDGMIQGRTAVFISHRLSSTRFCDRILFLENGRIIQEGNHRELMERGGAYAELFALQARYYQEKNKEGEQYA